ncbi:hypothetical protein B7486_78110, partial [cyanobacterium TDX16]
MTCHTFGSRRLPALGTAALCALLAVAALLISTPSPASAAPASQMMYSNDGGVTWSPDATVAPGGTLLA